jgi:hypothetical protein
MVALLAGKRAWSHYRLRACGCRAKSSKGPLQGYQRSDEPEAVAFYRKLGPGWYSRVGCCQEKGGVGGVGQSSNGEIWNRLRQVQVKRSDGKAKSSTGMLCALTSKAIYLLSRRCQPHLSPALRLPSSARTEHDDR